MATAIQGRPCCPAVEHMSNSSVDEADAERPEVHLRLLDTAVTASEEDDNGVCEDSCEVSEDTSDESREEQENCRWPSWRSCMARW